MDGARRWKTPPRTGSLPISERRVGQSRTRYGNPYDAVAKREGEIRYLEAKGTETAGAAVIVTPNEVAFARDHPGQCVMGVLANVRFRPDGGWTRPAAPFRSSPGIPTPAILRPAP